LFLFSSALVLAFSLAGPKPWARGVEARVFVRVARRALALRARLDAHARLARGNPTTIQMVKLSTAHRVARVAKPSITTPARSSRTAGVARAEAKACFASSLAACVAIALSVSAPDVALALEANERDSDFVAGASQFASLGSRGPGPVMDDGSI